jgi:hypothetical protein
MRIDLQVVNGWATLPAFLKLPSGAPRFHIEFPADGAERAAMIEMMAFLSRQGFRHFRPPGQETDGELSPFSADDPYVGNVFSMAAGLEL